MGSLVVSNAMLQCSFGAAPCTLMITPDKLVNGGGQAAANVDDYATQNISTFGMCSSLGNPSVASATSAASGVLTPQACSPQIAAMWVPGAIQTQVGGSAALDDSSICNCSYGGVIQITYAGQIQVSVG